ncbi:hypothetical protein KPC_1070 [Acinetobacter stercoris]|uniref:Uncharacterized protein n=2 Tax=Acinetobacter stercoris TaxID=2126983 RepID=A0A2U3MWT2_9GAMM|nr:hypothetical protein KPC_1070 [Acinetobacter stercoris]
MMHMFGDKRSPSYSEASVQNSDFGYRMLVLKKRQRHIMMLSITSFCVAIFLILAVFFQNQVVYGFWGMSKEIQQLHIPVSADPTLVSFVEVPDYFLSLFKWIGWLFLKIIASFFGAFIAVYFLKKFQFFKIRFQSFVLKFVGWLISFIVIWSGLTYVQYDFRNKYEKRYEALVHYDQTIQQSEIAQFLNESNDKIAVKNYLLAQTALLHRPVDTNTAKAYVSVLVKEENNNPEFIEYGFKPEQLWTMQYQVYGQAVTPLAKSVNPQVLQAEKISKTVHLLLIFSLIVSVISSLILWFIYRRLKNRFIRIEQQLNR